jgi:putative ABC transport system substrate-binding protein
MARHHAFHWSVLLALLVVLFTVGVAHARGPFVIGFLALGSKTSVGGYYEAFKEGLSENGLREHVDYRIEGRWANGDPARLEPLAMEIAAMKPDIVAAAPAEAVIVAVRVIPNIPIVQANGGDPVRAGLATSLSKPGGRVTGVSNIIGEVSGKNVELLLASMPQVHRIGFLYEPSSSAEESIESARRALESRNLERYLASATSPDRIEMALSALAGQGVEALIILSGGFFPSERHRIIDLANKHRWPVVGGLKEYAEAGGLIGYGADRKALYCRSA